GIEAGSPPGELRDLADRNITTMVIPERTLISGGLFDYYVQGSQQITAEDAIRILAGLGTGNDPILRDVALNEIADLVQPPSNMNLQDSLPLDAALTALEQMAKNGNASMQAFVGAELAAIAAHGTPVATVMDHLVKAVDHRQLSADQAMALFAGAGANGTGAVRNACADAML